MWDIPDKVANNGASVAGKHLHSEFNNRQHEIEKVVTSTGMALTAYPIDPNSTADPNETMLAEAIARLVSLGIAGTDSGVANAYVLGAIGNVVAPKALFDGMTVVTEPVATNTGPSTANVFGLGIKALRTYADAALVGGEVVLGRPTAWRYKAAANGGDGAWLIRPWADAKQIKPITAIPSTFKSVRTNAASFSNNTWTKVVGGTLSANQLDGATHDGTTFTCGGNDAGLWFFSFMGIMTSEEFVISLYKNGVRYLEGDGDGYTGLTSYGRYASSSGVIQLVAGNTVELYAYQRNNAGSSATLSNGIWYGTKIRA